MDKYDSIIYINGDYSMDLFKVLLVLYDAHTDDLSALENIKALTDRFSNMGFIYDATGYIYERIRILKKDPLANDPERFRGDLDARLKEYMPGEDIHTISDDDQNDFAVIMDSMILPHLDDSEVAALNGLKSILRMLAEQVPHTTESVKALTAKVHERLAKLV
jgi:hypothetical protein